MEINEIKDVYLNPQEETKYIATVKVLKYVKSGLPFINEEDVKEKEIVYNLEYWECEVVSSNYYPKGYKRIFPIRCVYLKGILLTDKSDSMNTNPELEEIEEQFSNELVEDYPKIDKFLTLDGEEIY